MLVQFRGFAALGPLSVVRLPVALVFLFIMSFVATVRGAAQGEISSAELDRIGRRIWQNECGGSVDGLTSWNTGEAFASLGIGHFIWYPAGAKGPFDESFPMLITWMRKSGVSVPSWLGADTPCPWPNRASFLKDRNSPRQKELRAFLARTIREQTRFVVDRLDATVPRLLAGAGRNSGRVGANLQALRQTSAGNFALIDYVNFKGDGLSSTERYKGEGWGLLQVLTAMEQSTAAGAPRAFAEAAKRTLTRRVDNSPPARNERIWLPGWLNRCAAYAR